MAMYYLQLQYDERWQIRALHTRGISTSEIAPTGTPQVDHQS